MSDKAKMGESVVIEATPFLSSVIFKILQMQIDQCKSLEILTVNKVLYPVVKNPVD